MGKTCLSLTHTCPTPNSELLSLSLSFPPPASLSVSSPVCHLAHAQEWKQSSEDLRLCQVRQTDRLPLRTGMHINQVCRGVRASRGPYEILI